MYRRPREHKRVSRGRARLYRAGPGRSGRRRCRWRSSPRQRETWAYALGKFCIDPIWWFFLFWLPGFLADRYELNILQFGPPLVAIYLLSDVGSIAGGWLSSRMIKARQDASITRAR